jgi:lysophospholipase L1-like esterase
MKRFLSLSAIFIVAFYAQAQTVELANRKIAFLGDSITQGGGYVSFIAYYLNKANPQKEYDIYSLGLSSETTSGLSEESHLKHGFPRPCLHERLERLLAKVKPDIVFACYGINDGIYLPLADDRFQAFKTGILKMIQVCKANGVKEIFIITPPIYDEPQTKDVWSYESVMAAYAAWEKSLTIPHVQVIDLHTAMRAARDAQPSVVLSKDKVHPGEEGHLLMARIILNGLNVSLPNEALVTIKADPLFNLIAKQRSLRANAWMPYIGYTREKTFRAESVTAQENEVANLQSQINALRRK